MDTKLTVRVERDLIDSAKRYAQRQGITLSQLIEDYLRSLAIQQDEKLFNTPILQKLSGILPSATTLDEYHRHLNEKYGWSTNSPGCEYIAGRAGPAWATLRTLGWSVGMHRIGTGARHGVCSLRHYTILPDQPTYYPSKSYPGDQRLVAGFFDSHGRPGGDQPGDGDELAWFWGCITGLCRCERRRSLPGHAKPGGFHRIAGSRAWSGRVSGSYGSRGEVESEFPTFFSAKDCCQRIRGQQRALTLANWTDWEWF